MLITLHLREKQELYEANAALRKAIENQGIPFPKLGPQLEQNNAAVDQLRLEDTGVNLVLLLAAQAEAETQLERAQMAEVQLKVAQERTAVQFSQEQSAAGAGSIEDCSVEVLQLENTHQIDASISSEAGVKLEAGRADPSRRHSTPAPDLQNNLSELQSSIKDLQISLNLSRKETFLANEQGEQMLQIVKQRFAEAQQSQQDLLKVAQDGRLAAESRYEAAEHKSQLLEHELAARDQLVSKLQSQVIALEEQLLVATSSAAFKQIEVKEERARVEGKLEYSARSLRRRLGESEMRLDLHKRQLTSSDKETELLSRQLHTAQQTIAQLSAELRIAEAGLEERDSILAQLAVAKSCLAEVKRDDSKMAELRSLAEQTEEKLAQAEEELTATAHLASSLESKLASALVRIDLLQIDVQEAEKETFEIRESIAEKVQHLWASAGGDRCLWPPAALDEIENVESRLAAVSSSLKLAQAQAQEELKAREAEYQQRVAAERRALLVEDVADRRVREAELRSQVADANALSVSLKLEEYKSTIFKYEKEKAERKAGMIAPYKETTSSGNWQTGNGNMQAPCAAANVALPFRTGKDVLHNTDITYMKNVLLKFLESYAQGRNHEWMVMLPAVAAMLRISQAEYINLRDSLESSNSLKWIFALQK